MSARAWITSAVANVAATLDELDDRVEDMLDATPQRAKIEARSARRPKYVSRALRPRYPTPQQRRGVDEIPGDDSHDDTHASLQSTPSFSGGVEVASTAQSALTAEANISETSLPNTPSTMSSSTASSSSSSSISTSFPPDNATTKSATVRAAAPNAILDDDIVQMLQSENARLKDRIRAQDAELEAIDAQMLDTQDELERVEQLHQSYCDDAEAREDELERRVRDLEQVTSASSSDTLSIVTERDERIAELEAELARESSAKDAQNDFLQQQLEDAQLEAEDWERQCNEARGKSQDVGQGREQIIADLRDSVSKLEQQRRTETDRAARLLREARERERNAQLANTDLTRSLAAAERSNENLREKLRETNAAAERKNMLGAVAASGAISSGDGQVLSTGRGSGGGGSGGHHRRLAAAEEALETERERVQSLEREMKMVRHELSLANTTTETVERRMALTLAEKDAAMTALQREIGKLQGSSGSGIKKAGGSDAGKQELRDQLQVLTERVLGYQSTIEQLTSQRVMLQQQCVELREDNRVLREAVDSGGFDGFEDEDDLESGGSTHVVSSHSRKLMRRRGSGGDVGGGGGVLGGSSGGSTRRSSSITSIKQLRPLLSKNRTLASAVRGVDRFSFAAMNIIRRFPTARLLFLVYLVSVHAWSVYLVLHHSSGCDHEALSTKASGGTLVVPRVAAGAMPGNPGPPR